MSAQIANFFHLQEMIQSRQRLNENIGAFVAELISTSDEKVQSLLEIKVEMPVKVTANEFVNLLFGHRVEILELVQRRELLHVESVRRDDVGLALEQMFSFVAGDLRHGGEDVREIGGGTFETVTEDECKLERECQLK